MCLMSRVDGKRVISPGSGRPWRRTRKTASVLRRTGCDGSASRRRVSVLRGRKTKSSSATVRWRSSCAAPCRVSSGWLVFSPGRWSAAEVRVVAFCRGSSNVLLSCAFGSCSTVSALLVPVVPFGVLRLLQLLTGHECTV